MKPNELRIGNWISTIEGLTRVTAISKGGIITTASMSDGDHLEFAEPISITEEILLKAGFEESNAHRNPQYVLRVVWHNGNEMRIEFFLLEKVDDKFFSEHCFNRAILHVHQLQNLYFALTGQELEINL